MNARTQRPDFRALEVCVVLERPELSGGVKVVLQLAEIAKGMGHRVRVFGRGPLPPWGREIFGGAYLDRDAAPLFLDCDLAVATYYTTLECAAQFRAAQHVHFCQGYEGCFPHLEAEWPAIRREYRRPWPILTVNRHLGRWLAGEFGKSWCSVPPPADAHFRPRFRLGPRRRARIAIPGNYEVTWKGVRTCLDAVDALRAGGLECEVVRFSLVPISSGEISLYGSPFRVVAGAAPRIVAKELRRCDLLLQGSTIEEGFGLPALEAALSGVPVVCTDLPAMRLLGIPASCRAPLGDPEAMAAAAAFLLSGRERWLEYRRSLLAKVRARFSSEAIERRLSRAVQKLSAAVCDPARPSQCPGCGSDESHLA